MIKKAEERHDGIARLNVLQGARHLPFGGRPAQKGYQGYCFKVDDANQPEQSLKEVSRHTIQLKVLAN